ncbi:MAG: 5-hydroxyisourate hydrolase [Blastocatellia bacterium]|jgi:5-hydroxyisourate hydrolase|nr:5-hydroxyisourate hydrolase [Blastocatellia bacterium]
MSAITTHILDVARGRPAGGVPVVLEHESAGEWTEIGSGRTDGDGRLKDLLADDFALTAGRYRLTFDTAAYFFAQQTESFYPAVTIAFIVRDEAEHYHVPLLLSPYGYSTYRGS